MTMISALFQNWRETVTFLSRLVAFAVTLVIIGAFFLPWVRLDGALQAQSGAELTATIVSPTIKYLFAVSPVQTVALIVCPVVTILFALRIVVKYARRKTAPFATLVVLAASIAIIYAASDLVASSAHIGLSLVVVLSVVLLVHQVLIKLRSILWEHRRLPSAYRVLSIVTGSGTYRWNEGSLDSEQTAGQTNPRHYSERRRQNRPR